MAPMDAPTKQRLLQIALAQRNLSIGLAVLGGVVVFAVVAVGGGQDAALIVRIAAVLINLYLAAASYQLSRALGHARGLRITVILAAVFIPFACVVIPLLLLGRARRSLRDDAIAAGFFKVRRADMHWLQSPPGPAMICPECNYDLAGIDEHAPCPECGKARS